MDAITKVLGQVPPEVKQQGSQEEKLEEIWRAMGRSRNGLQTRVAGELAEKLEGHRRAPRLPTDDPRKAAKRLEKMLNGETSLPMSVGFAFVECLPEPFHSAAIALIYPSRAAQAELDGCPWEANAAADNLTDRIRNDVAFHGLADRSLEELKLMDRGYANEEDTIVAVRTAIQKEMKSREGETLKAVNR